MNQEKPEITILLDICFDGYTAVCIMIDDISLPWWTHQWNAMITSVHTSKNSLSEKSVSSMVTKCSKLVNKVM